MKEETKKTENGKVRFEYPISSVPIAFPSPLDMTVRVQIQLTASFLEHTVCTLLLQ